MDSGSCCREDKLVRDEVVGMKLFVDRYCVKRKGEKAEKRALNISEPLLRIGGGIDVDWGGQLRRIRSRRQM
jgi:hypothetical protein